MTQYATTRWTSLKACATGNPHTGVIQVLTSSARRLYFLKQSQYHPHDNTQAPVAQTAEHQLRKLETVGSSPTRGSPQPQQENKENTQAPVAQAAEHLPCKQEVASSNLARGSTTKTPPFTDTWAQWTIHNPHSFPSKDTPERPLQQIHR